MADGDGQLAKSPTSGQFRRRLLPLIVLFWVVVSRGLEPAAGWREDAILRPDSASPCTLRDPRMNPTREAWEGHDFVWQIPRNPRAIILFLHGESQDHLRFFDPGPKCAACYGMPENRRAVLDALQVGFAVIAIKSIRESWDRWPLDDSADMAMVIAVMGRWTREHSLEVLPMVGWGHSAGGFFLSTLTDFVPFRAVLLMCSEGEARAIERADPDRYPPTFFAYMNYAGTSGMTTRAAVEAQMAILSAKGVSVSSRRFCPRPLTESLQYFTERIRCMTDDMSRAIVSAFGAEGWLDEDGFLSRDPEYEDWEAILWKWEALPYCKAEGDLCLADDVEQEINLAHSTHTFSSDADEEIFSWMTSILWPLSSAAADSRITSASE